MANNDIKQKIILEGEQEYNRALKDARRNLKTLKSELKAETAELGNNATAQQKNEARIKSLQKQIKEQEKIVKTYKDALDQVKEKYSDNEDAVQKWEVKLNEARTTLANMQNELEGVGKEFGKVQTNADTAAIASKSVADAIGKLGDIGGVISDGIESAFMGMMERVRSVCAEVWDLIAETAAKADHWGDLAGFYGSTAEEIQSIDRAVSTAGANFEDFIALMNQLQFRGKDKKLVEWLGISDVNYENDVQFTLLALQRMNELKEKIGTGEFNNQLGDVFSGKSAGFLELIDKYDRIMELRQENKENGYLLDQHELDTMSSVNNTLSEIDEKWDMLKSKFASGFGDVTLKITTEANATLDALSRYFNADTPEERDAELKNIETHITAMFDTAAAAITDGIAALDKVAENLKASDNPTAQALGNILDGLVEALKWFTEDNMNNVVKALEILAGFWVGAKALKMAGTIAELAANIKTISFAKLIGGASGGLGGLGGSIGETAGESFLSVLKTGLPGVLGTALIAAGFSWASNQRNNNRQEVRGTEEYLQAQAKDSSDLLLDYILAQQEMSSIDIINATGEKVQEIQKRISDAYDALMASENGEAALKAYSDWRQEHSYGNMDWFLPDYLGDEETVNLDAHSIEEIENAIQDWWDANRNVNNGLESENEAWNALSWMQEVLGEDFFDVYERIIQHLDELSSEDQMGLEDIPADWWKINGGNAGNTDGGLTSLDAKDMTGAVRQMPAAVAKAVGGLTVKLDGATVGRIVAPYVSREIAHGISG